MAEELKLTIPTITETELETIDNNLHEIASEFIKAVVKDKDLLLSQHIIKRLEEENKQLKEYCCKRNDCSGRLKENRKLTGYEIINELEKWLKEEAGNSFYPVNYLACICMTLQKIELLKGSDK